MKLLIKNINKTSRCLSFSGIYLLLEVAARGAGGEPATPQPHARMGVGVGTGTRRRSSHARSKGRDAAAARWSPLRRDGDTPSQLAHREAGARERTRDADVAADCQSRVAGTGVRSRDSGKLSIGIRLASSCDA
jgi:hypothetical protein